MVNPKGGGTWRDPWGADLRSFSWDFPEDRKKPTFIVLAHPRRGSDKQSPRQEQKIIWTKTHGSFSGDIRAIRWQHRPFQPPSCDRFSSWFFCGWNSYRGVNGWKFPMHHVGAIFFQAFDINTAARRAKSMNLSSLKRCDSWVFMKRPNLWVFSSWRVPAFFVGGASKLMLGYMGKFWGMCLATWWMGCCHSSLTPSLPGAPQVWTGNGWSLLYIDMITLFTW